MVRRSSPLLRARPVFFFSLLYFLFLAARIQRLGQERPFSEYLLSSHVDHLQECTNLGFRGIGELGLGEETCENGPLYDSRSRQDASGISQRGLEWAARFRRWVFWVFQPTN